MAKPQEQEPQPLAREFSARRSRRELILNLVVGFCLAFSLHALPETSWLSVQRDRILDGMIRLRAGTPLETLRGAPFTFIDIDEATYRRWGEPFHVPRDELAKLMAFALSGDPALLLVDVDLSRRAGDEDEELLRLLGLYAEDRDFQAPIILARAFRANAGSLYSEERTSFLESELAASTRIRWGSPLFVLDPDLHIRRFRTYEPTCTGSRASVVPAMQLLAAVLVVDPTSVSDLEEAMASAAPNCVDPGARPKPARGQLDLAGSRIELSPTRISGRVLFSFGALGANPMTPFRGGRVPLLTRLPAHLIADASFPPDPAIVAGRIVVIGASYAESRDLHPTPLGWMPGALIVANAIHSLTEYGSLRPPPLIVVVFAQLTLIALVSFLLARVRSGLVVIMAAPTTLVLLLPLSFWLFRYGVWIDLAIPILAVQVLALLRRTLDQLVTLQDWRAGKTIPIEASDSEEPCPTGPASETRDAADEQE